ncbi:hypothetical protein CANCADRAFT_139795 [Tortispora caseinolytica NRRL Y-17796]|uniref:Saccharopine dehydrogenase NADP binding domain-containing protein n=1 Tax=Tortispora caseinolytica NRRL Y-17796 TaxID=767744 RepID=A0A1E4TCH8_9ASCO|nr:hypothetical protein CANCADRAFT_139795 [Tortispora caseinolytica NRRL Y-17796]
MTKKYAITVTGITGTTGQYVLPYLLLNLNGDINWAVCSRSKAKAQAQLDATVADLTAVHAKLPDIVEVDLTNQQDINRLVTDTEVVVGMAGPFPSTGYGLQTASAEAGIGYVDLCGDAPHIAKLIREYHERAETSGSTLINACGTSSFLQDTAIRWLVSKVGPLSDVRSIALEMLGSLSGGTVNSMTLNYQIYGSYSALGGPSSFSSERNDTTTATTKLWDYVKKPAKEPRLGGMYVVPSMTQSINTCTVLRSYTLLNRVYGPNFTYAEYDKSRNRVAASVWTFALKCMTGMMRTSWFRRILTAFRPPGTVPSKRTTEAAHATFVIVGNKLDGNPVYMKINVAKDPMYVTAATCICLAAIELLKQRRSGTAPSGIVTPATLGPQLFDQLQEHNVAAEIKSSWP